MATPLYPNATDKQIADRESAAFDGNIPVNETGVTRQITKSENYEAQSGTVFIRNSGVIMNHDDRPWRFGDDVGKP